MSLLILNGKSCSSFILRLDLLRRGIHGRCRIGNRDWVGFGVNGSANYKDDAHFPFPAIRFKENTRDICALREKEKCDWRMLCCEEKKALYRASFCQTFAEFQHPTGQWKFIVGVGLFLCSFTFWAFMFLHYFVYEPLPASLSHASQKMEIIGLILSFVYVMKLNKLFLR
ncbi:hypothetical protein PYW08_009440 [Mythimna loreyi]|uniref:Uncharacterized protein n=1 Tax=Mythimna loreyi TaxID=667449 RepID=A0ACC2Q9S9_9NEOP|nr:hypothetical protein PYW08_009440 [Mythimna loreyi]